MEIFPAVDIRGGQVVRLQHGDYDSMQIYGNNPKEQAERFLASGARNLHVVDLDGAKDGNSANFAAIREIASLHDQLFIEVGGGIRTEADIARMLALGVQRVILGTVAVRNFAFIEDMVQVYGEHIAVGVDARDGKVAVQGWLETTQLDSLAFCRQLMEAGVQTVVYTDIAKDGALAGTNLPAYSALREFAALSVVASGGISYEHELAALRDMGTYAAILGKALYVGQLDLARAIAIGDG